MPRPCLCMYEGEREEVEGREEEEVEEKEKIGYIFKQGWKAQVI